MFVYDVCASTIMCVLPHFATEKLSFDGHPALLIYSWSACTASNPAIAGHRTKALLHAVCSICT